jgi:hypothetical protein
LSIRNNGDGTLNWSASADQSWIRLSASTGAAPANISISADPTGLPVGQYAGQVTVTTSDASNGSQTVAVTLSVVAGNTLQFNSLSYSIDENEGTFAITVTRSGDSSGQATVDYATSDGTARQVTDYTIAAGTLHFAAGEVSKRITILITDDAYVEGDETINFTLSNPSGAILSTSTSVTLTIRDNDTAPSATNPVDDARLFVRQHYLDFLNREPDQGGLDYWTSQITQCGNDAACVHVRRIGVSAAYFIELEFQNTGYYVYRFYKASYGTRPTYSQFMPDRSRVVGGSSEEQSRQAFADDWVQRPSFLSVYPSTMSNADFINKLFDTANLRPYTTERQQKLNEMNQGRTRAQVIRDVIEIGEFKQREFNPAFVLMQYFGYLRRNPDQGGYDFWLDVVNSRATNNYRAMVCAFLTSAEYQQRFGSAVTRANSDCAVVGP